MFTPEQKAELAADLDRSKVKTRKQSGRQLSYVEGWTVIAEANRIFGFDGWTSETIELKCVSEREREIGEQKVPGWGVTYIARVRVTIGDIVRDGCGAGHGIDRDLGQAHESALKEAETDSRKRAFMTFGNPFGLALYDKTQEHVSDGNGHAKPEARLPAERPTPEAIDVSKRNAAACIKVIRNIQRSADLETWKNLDSTKAARRTMTDADFETVNGEFLKQQSALEKAERLGAG